MTFTLVSTLREHTCASAGLKDEAFNRWTLTGTVARQLLAKAGTSLHCHFYLGAINGPKIGLWHTRSNWISRWKTENDVAGCVSLWFLEYTLLIAWVPIFWQFFRQISEPKSIPPFAVNGWLRGHTHTHNRRWMSMPNFPCVGVPRYGYVQLVGSLVNRSISVKSVASPAWIWIRWNGAYTMSWQFCE